MSLELFGAVALATACALLSGAHTQPVTPEPPVAAAAELEPVAAAPATPQGPCCKLAALTPVELEIVTPASSRTSKAGDQIAIRLVEPLVVDGRTVIPVGAPGIAEVIQASKARMMGKAGELSLAARYLDLNGQRIRLKRFGYGRSTGKGNDTTVLVATAAIGLAGLLISGGNIDIASGTRAHAVVAAETLVAPAGETATQEEGQ